MSDNSFIGSQAFNRVSAAHETVIPNSGSLTLAIPILNLVGINKSIQLNLSLSYFMGKQGKLGLPNNWTFGLPFVTPNQSVEVNGLRYIIDPTWKDATGYASGLKYENNHGRSFVSSLVPVALPYGNYPATYQYVFSEPDGSTYYFDAIGNLVMNADSFGNNNYYSYLNNGELLDYIIDSFGQKTTFGYNPGKTVIITPDNNQYTLNYSNSGISSLVDPMGYSTSFTYTQQGSFNVINTIVYPCGKNTEISYTSLNFYNDSKQLLAMPAVSDLKYVDSNNVLFSHYQYAYGTSSGGNTFTGYSQNFTLSGTSDGLLDSNNTLYLYDVQVRQLNDQGNILSLEEVYYSFAHVPVRHNTYVYDASGVQGGFSQVTSSYNITPDKHNQQPNYLSPKETDQFFFVNASDAGTAKLKLAMAYDEFGNLTSKKTSAYSTATSQFNDQLTEISSYFTQSVVGNKTLLKETTKSDNITGKAANTLNTLTADNNNIATSSVSYKNKGDNAWNNWKEQTMTFDAKGRELSEAIKWTKPGAVGAQSSQTQFSYTYNATNFSVTTSVTNALGKLSSHQMSTMNGKLLVQSQPSGTAIKYTYDALGRVLSKRLPSGAETLYEYKVFVTDNENSTLTTNAVKYQTKIISDVLGREISRLDNGNTLANGVMRVLSNKSYDLLGNVNSETDIFGSITQKEFNSLGKPTQTIDALGNKTNVIYDFVANQSTSTLNGIALQKMTLDSYGRTLTKDDLPNTSNVDQHSQYIVRTSSTYSGFGEKISESIASVTSGNVTLINTKIYDYDVESSVIKEDFESPEGTTYSKSILLDLNKKEISTSKLVNYSGRPQLQSVSDVATYNSLGLIVNITNQIDQSEMYQYNDDGQLLSKTLFDGTVISYDYTSDGLRASQSWQDAGKTFTTSYGYDATGQLLTSTDSSGAVTTTYSLDGIVLSTTYPDGKGLSYTLDKYSRKVIQKDIAGIETTYTFNAQNQLEAVTTNNDTLTYSYYSDTSKNSNIGALKSIALSEQYTEVFTYDAFNRKIGTSKVNPAGKILVKEDFIFTALNQVSNTTLASDVSTSPQLNQVRNFTYDALKQVTADVVNTGRTVLSNDSFTYDANANVLTKISNQETTTYTYNSIDQLTSFIIGSSKEKRLSYSQNGDLFIDAEGSQYTFDKLGKLLTIEGSNSVSYSYYANELLAKTATNSKSVSMYYNSLQQCVNSTDGNTITGFLLVGSRRYASYVDRKTPYYYGTNQRQDTIVGFNSDSVIEGTSEYQSYGEKSGDLGLKATNNFTWNQEYTDSESSLVYLRSRYFDPKTMRFISRDTKRVSNRYAFCNGDPINNIDPSGHDSKSNIELGVGIGAGVALVGAGIAAAVIWGPAVVGAVGGGAVVAGIGAGALAGGAALIAGAGAGTAGIVAAGGVVAGAIVASTVADASVGGTIGAAIGAGMGAYVGGDATSILIGGALGGYLGNAAGIAIGSTATSLASAASAAGTAVLGVADSIATTAFTAGAAASEAVIATATAAATTAAEASAAVIAGGGAALEVLGDIGAAALLLLL